MPAAMIKMHYLMPSSRGMYRKLALMAIILVWGASMQAQDLGNLKDIKPVSASGGVGLTTMFTNSTDTTNRRDPFFWQFQANLNLNFFGIIDAPFALVLNSQKNTVNQPALPTQFGISPKYKAVTGHFGYRSVRLSDYTLGGLMFLGAAVEVKPQNHWLSGVAMYGRFSEALQPILGTGLGKYSRLGYGMKIKAGDDTNYVGLVGFRAKDDPESIDTRNLAKDLPPQENLSWALIGGKKVGRFSMHTEFTTSALTRDTRNSEFLLNDFSYYNNLGGLFTPNATTNVRTAFVLNSTMAMDKYNLLFAYKRIAPEFVSLGAVGLNNDLEEISTGASWQMMQGKLSLGTNVGVQRNNLDDKIAEGVRKLVSALNVFWLATDQLSFNVNYSGFNSNTVRTAQFISDTLEFFQVTNNGTFTTTYRLKSTNPQSLVLNANLQKAFDSDKNANDGANMNFAYTVSFPASKVSGALSYNYNVMTNNGMDVATSGPTVSVNKRVKEALTLSMAGSLLASTMGGQKLSNITNINMATRYTWKKQHGFALTYLLLNRASQVEGRPSIAENRVNFNYNYRF